MTELKEKDVLRLAMILENQGSTTRDRYICKFAEYILFDSENEGLTVSGISTRIKNEFLLEFDLTEIELAIKAKGKGRIINAGNKYLLNPRVASQLAKESSVSEKLLDCLRLYAREVGEVDEKSLLKLIQSFLYSCFNTNASNLLSIIDGDSKEISDLSFDNSFCPSQEEIDVINDFLRWENADKNKLLYSIVSSCYEYCMITSNKNPAVSKSVFRGKRFFLDTNIIFRIAGFNKEERRYVSKTFVEKCKEVGITLCYSSAVLDEIYRVIDAQIKHVQTITNLQYPLSPKSLENLYDDQVVNDFYQMYYDWCKEPQNRYDDYTAFRSFLTSQVTNVIRDFIYIDASIVGNISKEEGQLFESLMQYKTANRKNKIFADESVKTDVRQVLYLNSIRPKNADNLWSINDYIVSADQLLVSWSEEKFNGVPIVVIPSLWLSIILKVSGRATDDDFKSFCAFMTLRHRKVEQDSISVNPGKLLSIMSERTVDSRLKENIIAEIVANKERYSFENPEDYEMSVDRAFDVIIGRRDDLHKEELAQAVEAEKESAMKAFKKYQKDLEGKKTAEEYAKIIAQKKAEIKVERYSKRAYIPFVVMLICGIIAVVVAFCWIIKIDFIMQLLTAITKDGSVIDKIISGMTWLFNIFAITLPTYIKSVWDYLSSDKRKENLCSKYFKEQLEILNKNDGGF